MTMFRVRVHRAIHEGGTKFYQQVQVDCLPKGKAFLVQHWGKWIAGRRGYDLASGGRGTRLIKKCDIYKANDEFFNKEEAKRKRGYKFADCKTHECNNSDELSFLLKETLGATSLQAADVTGYFGMPATVAVAAGSATYTPVTEVGGSDVPETEGWGQW